MCSMLWLFNCTMNLLSNIYPPNWCLLENLAAVWAQALATGDNADEELLHIITGQFLHWNVEEIYQASGLSVVAKRTDGIIFDII